MCFLTDGIAEGWAARPASPVKLSAASASASAAAALRERSGEASYGRASSGATSEPRPSPSASRHPGGQQAAPVYHGADRDLGALGGSGAAPLSGGSIRSASPLTVPPTSPHAGLRGATAGAAVGTPSMRTAAAASTVSAAPAMVSSRGSRIGYGPPQGGASGAGGGSAGASVSFGGYMSEIAQSSRSEALRRFLQSEGGPVGMPDSEATAAPSLYPPPRAQSHARMLQPMQLDMRLPISLQPAGKQPLYSTSSSGAPPGPQPPPPVRQLSSRRRSAEESRIVSWH